MNFPNNDLPLRTPFMNTDKDSSTDSTTDNEQNYNTLVTVQIQMGDELEALQTIHTIDVTKSELNVKQQIVANKKAYDILLPIYNALTTAIDGVKTKWKQG